MLPTTAGDVSTILKFMSSCNKSAVILPRPMAIKVHKTLQNFGKPSYFGVDKVTEMFWGYRFRGYFPSNLVFRPRYLFDAGVFDWWQKFLDYSVTRMVTNSYGKSLDLDSKNQTIISEKGMAATVAVLTLIPGFGLLISLIVFVGFEINGKKILYKTVSVFFKIWYDEVLKLYQEFKGIV